MLEMNEQQLAASQYDNAWRAQVKGTAPAIGDQVARAELIMEQELPSLRLYSESFHRHVVLPKAREILTAYYTETTKGTLYISGVSSYIEDQGTPKSEPSNDPADLVWYPEEGNSKVPHEAGTNEPMYLVFPTEHDPLTEVLFGNISTIIKHINKQVKVDTVTTTDQGVNNDTNDLRATAACNLITAIRDGVTDVTELEQYGVAVMGLNFDWERNGDLKYYAELANTEASGLVKGANLGAYVQPPVNVAPVTNIIQAEMDAIASEQIDSMVGKEAVNTVTLAVKRAVGNVASANSWINTPDQHNVEPLLRVVIMDAILGLRDRLHAESPELPIIVIAPAAVAVMLLPKHQLEDVLRATQGLKTHPDLLAFTEQVVALVANSPRLATA